jgi:hypothetical protein
VVFQALGAPSDRAVFLWPDGSAVAIAAASLVSLEAALLEGHSWSPLPVTELLDAFSQEVPTVWLEPLGMSPLRGVEKA